LEFTCVYSVPLTKTFRFRSDASDYPFPLTPLPPPQTPAGFHGDGDSTFGLDIDHPDVNDLEDELLALEESHVEVSRHQSCPPLVPEVAISPVHPWCQKSPSVLSTLGARSRHQSCPPLVPEVTISPVHPWCQKSPSVLSILGARSRHQSYPPLVPEVAISPVHPWCQKSPSVLKELCELELPVTEGDGDKINLAPCCDKNFV
jgi:hypothetical protein